MSTEPAPAVPLARPGRPSRLQAAELTRRILDAATAGFLTDGYRATSIEAVAKAARVSKRTFYHRFAGKPELFEAVIRRLIEGWRIPFDRAMAPGAMALDVPLDQRLAGIARLILAAALSREAIALHRLMVSEAPTFPELARVVNEHGHAMGVRAIAALLAAEAASGRLVVADPALAAEQFLHLVVGAPQRRALGLDAPLDAPALDRWVHATVTLFLKGLAP
ncbi:MAG TPA: TetR/AcrR family transcriptional regulator [Candidatus Sulfotelmatobacter sp.]|nr:TetR/AcrR family transcriptional regulator [Candidatus Sulfotelmatobacter sp.]